MDTGVGVGITGDTAYMPELARFFSGIDLLVTEGSTGLSDPPPESPGGHQSIRQAARLAKAAGVGTVSIAHTDMRRREEFEQAASEAFGKTCHLPWPGEQCNLEDRSVDRY